ncbi:MAG: TlpA family protein disulfide reductase [Alphaproteobacteria bacterium]|nr:TlpA family protein disulfide reductase [Alphaproteobacteria bacterium]
MTRFMKALSVLVVLCVAGLGLLLYYRAQHPPAIPVPLAANGTPAEPEFKFTVLDAPQPAPALAFTTREGAPKTLADFRGRLLLVNFWATWCGPCVAEMPSLDRLQARLGSRLMVLAISEDRRGGDVVDPFLAKLKLADLAIYLDTRNSALQAFGLAGLPTSILIDRDGRMVWRVEGGVDWTSPEAAAKLAPYLAPTPDSQHTSAAH